METTAPDVGLQLYDYVRDAHVADLDVAPRNLVSGDGGSDEPMEPYVSHAVFSADGSILVTVDRRSERPMPGMCVMDGQLVGTAAAGGAAGAVAAAGGGGGEAVAAAAAASQPEETLRIWERRVVPSSTTPAAGEGRGKEENIGDAATTKGKGGAGGGGFVCVCVCDAPHSGAVTSVTLRGSAGSAEAMACTVSLDGDVKTWTPNPSHAARGG